MREASPDPPPPSPDAPPLTREAYAVAVDTTRTANTLLRNAINTGDEASVLDALHKAWELWKTCGRYIAKDSRVPPELRSHFKQLETRLWYDVGFFSADAMRDLERKEESPTSRMRVVMITLEVACDLERELEEVTALLPPA